MSSINIEELKFFLKSEEGKALLKEVIKYEKRRKTRHNTETKIKKKFQKVIHFISKKYLNGLKVSDLSDELLNEAIQMTIGTSAPTIRKWKSLFISNHLLKEWKQGWYVVIEKTKKNN